MFIIVFYVFMFYSTYKTPHGSRKYVTSCQSHLPPCLINSVFSANLNCFPLINTVLHFSICFKVLAIKCICILSLLFYSFHCWQPRHLFPFTFLIRNVQIRSGLFNATICRMVHSAHPYTVYGLLWTLCHEIDYYTNCQHDPALYTNLLPKSMAPALLVYKLSNNLKLILHTDVTMS